MMIKTILYSIFLLLISQKAMCQDAEDLIRNKFHFGIKAGANFANVYDTEGEDFKADPKFGFAGGAFMSIPLGSMFGIQPEILYSQKGFKVDGILFDRPYSVTRTTDFIDVPIFLAVKPLPVLSILGGAQFSYLLRRKDVFKSTLGDSEQIEEFKNDNIRKNILAAVFGLDVNLNKVVFGIRTGWDLLANNGDGSSQTPRYKNAWLQATVGYRFL